MTLLRMWDLFDVWCRQMFGRCRGETLDRVNGITTHHDAKNVRSRIWTYRLQFRFRPESAEAEHWEALTKTGQTVGSIGRILDKENSVLGIYEVTKGRTANVHGWFWEYIFQDPIYCDAEECRGKDAASTNTWSCFKACRFVFPHMDYCSSLLVKINY